MMRLTVLAAGLFLATIKLSSAQEQLIVKLPSYNVDKSSITVSGISSGACFATQFHVAYSSVVSGMGSWAGILDTCYWHYGLDCLTFPDIINVDRCIEDVDSKAESGVIDGTENMSNDRIYIHHGTLDEAVYPENAEKLQEFYQNYVADDDVSIQMKTDLPCGHATTSDHFGTPCGVSDNHLYIENCAYNSVHEMMDHVNADELNPPVHPGTYNGSLLKFDQTEFFADAQEASMEQYGYFYTPPDCEDGSVQCKLHVYFHGCSMNAEEIGNHFIINSGFLEVADANNIVIVFPSTMPKEPLNPYACWNWFGYLEDDESYLTKNATQMLGAYHMLARAADL